MPPSRGAPIEAAVAILDQPAPDLAAIPRSGREVAWPEELADQQAWIRRVVASRLSNPHEVDEVVQEVAVCVLRAGERPADAGRVRAWLFQIATRRVADVFRRQARRPGQRGLAEAAAEQAPADETESWQWLVAAEDADRLRAAAGQLPSLQQTLLRQRYTEQMSYAEMAARHDVTERAIEYQLTQARRRLRTLLSDPTEGQ